MKGIIALDLDGTVIHDGKSPSEGVTEYLAKAFEEGWQIIFITGRSLQWVKRALKAIPFPYILAVQNGALILEMPGEKELHRRYLDAAVYAMVDDISCEAWTPYALYTGDETDKVYWDPDHYKPDMQDYLRRRIDFYQENWENSSFKPESFSALKWIGEEALIQKVAEKVRKKAGLYCVVIKDPFDNSKYIAQATHPMATKGEALSLLRAGKKGVVIAAGDDHNDEPLLLAADIKIAMPQAPESLKNLADIVATEGLIKGLENARRR